MLAYLGQWVTGTHSGVHALYSTSVTHIAFTQSTITIVVIANTIEQNPGKCAGCCWWSVARPYSGGHNFRIGPENACVQPSWLCGRQDRPFKVSANASEL
jgi:hypothetical protein